ncbi:hypothetical protein D3C76_1055400 [compost metagenome]
MAAHLLDVTFHHVHAHATAGDVRHLLGGGEARSEDQHTYFFVGHIFVDRHPLRDRLRQDTLAIQACAIVGHFDTDVPALMFRREDQVAHRGFPCGNAVFRQLDPVVEAVTHQVR